MKWYIEVYGPIDVTVPDYKDPAPQTEQAYDSTELEARLERLEELLKQTLNPTNADEVQDEVAARQLRHQQYMNSQASQQSAHLHTKVKHSTSRTSYVMHSYCHNDSTNPKRSSSD